MSTNSSLAGIDHEESRFSKWSYQIPNILYNPMLPQSASREPSSLNPPPKPTPPPPVEIEQGVWEQDDDIIYAANWPPVQTYLSLVRMKGHLETAPSDLIFTLAALEVLNHPEDRAHWIFWAPNQYERTGNRVTAITSHRPRLIKSKVSWLGTSSYRGVVHAIQQKFEYVHVRKEWYPVVVVEHPQGEARKRTLRSNGGATEAPTINEFFLLDDTLTKKPAKKRKIIASPTADTEFKRATKPIALQSSPSSPVEKGLSGPLEQVTTDSASPTRSSTRVRRKVTPTSRSPRIITAPTVNLDSPTALNPVDATPLLLPAPAIMPSHSRSTSQASMKTVVESDRSTSVISSDTVVEALPSKKRKADDIDKTEDGPEDQEQALEETEGMVTRKRASKKACIGDAEQNSTSSRMSTPQAESPSKTTNRPRARAKRVRA